MDTLSEATVTNHQSVALIAMVLMLSLVCYAGGRVHQYFKQGLDRDHAFREGYNIATRSLFAMATRTSRAMEAPPPLDEEHEKTVTQMTTGSARVHSRHRVDTGDLSSAQRSQYPTAWEQYRGEAVE